MTSIMYALRSRLDFGVAMTPTEESMDMFRKHMPDAWILPCYSQEKLEAMLNVQRRCQREKKRSRHLFLFMDDCMYDKKVLRSTAMRDLFMNGRHLKITFCCAMQYIMDMGPDLRTQVDYVICTREVIIANKMKLWKYFFGMFERYDDFSRVMDKCTENYSALIMDNTVRTGGIADSIFWYRASLDVPAFKIGAESFWKLSRERSKTDDEAAEDLRTREQQEELLRERLNRRKMPILVQVEDPSIRTH